MNSITIIMYHYVRELPFTRYPEIKGLKVSEFKKQLDYLHKHFNFVTVEKCMEVLNGNATDFPENAVLLTFDDGYQEHFTEVFPILDGRGIQGAFFPPAQAILEHKVLDVNKIHFILASSGKPKQLVQMIHARLHELAKTYQLEEPEYYRSKLKSSEHRYDSQEVVYIKRLLQRELPEPPRKIIINELFEEYIEVDENVFAKELYMSAEQISCMRRNGMFIGGHGYSHTWLNAMSNDEQNFEIDKTLAFLNYVGADTDRWVMCYPYGAYNQKTIELLKSKKCNMGLTTQVGKASLAATNALTLERFDTNDLQNKIENKPSVISFE